MLKVLHSLKKINKEKIKSSKYLLIILFIILKAEMVIDNTDKFHTYENDCYRFAN